MSAVFKRELKGYFTSPIGWIYLAVFYFFAGLFLFLGPVLMLSPNMSSLFSSLQTIVMFLVPILTMRLFSEDKRQKTEQLLLTAPVGLTGIIFGKLLAAFTVFAMGFSATFIYALVLEGFGAVEWAIYFSNLIGMLLLGLALISIGAFISSLTENQVVAAIGGFAVTLLLVFVDTLASVFTTGWISAILTNLSVYTRYNDFSLGVINFSDIIFFLSVSAVFIFLTVRVFEKKRWS